MKAPTGHYRKLISDSKIRIAITHTAMFNCIKVDNTQVIEELKQSQDEYAQYYIDGLNNGTMITIVEQEIPRYFSPGELYFTT